MPDPVKKVLFVSSEIFPYLPESEVSLTGRYLPQGMQERKKEIRSFMPRYGCVNERKNQLHEVIRLSGMNLIIGDADHPLVIKVASIPSARMQVYFIDNEDYFKRKQIYKAEDGTFFQDNAERAIFFARGVLESVKKLRWAADIIHCQGWMASVVPLYLKKAYIQDPIFSNAKVVTSFYGDIPGQAFPDSLSGTILYGGVKPEDVALLDKPDGIKLAELAAQYSDGVIFSSKDVDPALADFCSKSGKKILPFNGKAMEDGSYIDEYSSFYDLLQE
ncbi:MAG: glycogen/starch synthase [Bacteroidales bacterium]|nr:glycogen/starch synthase [Bacteroidales bacterium]